MWPWKLLEQVFYLKGTCFLLIKASADDISFLATAIISEVDELIIVFRNIPIGSPIQEGREREHVLNSKKALP